MNGADEYPLGYWDDGDDTLYGEQDDPHCPECHAALESEHHEWDCSYAGDDDDDD